MSKYRYITVGACVYRSYVDIALPDDWDTQSDQERVTYVKQTAFDTMKEGYGADPEYARFWSRCALGDLEDWKISTSSSNASLPLESVAKKDLLVLILDGTYDYKDYIDDDDD